MDERDREVLRLNHRLLIDTLDLRNTTVLDKLQEQNVLSSGEQEEIFAQGTQRDQNAHLLLILNRKNSSLNPFTLLMKAMSEDYGFIIEKLAKTKESLEINIFSKGDRNCKQKFSSCVFCMVVRDLTPNDVSHYLFEIGVITGRDLEEVNNRNQPRHDRVIRLINALQSSRDKNKAWNSFSQSLKEKYPHLNLESNVNNSLDLYTRCRCDQSTARMPCEHDDRGIKKKENKSDYTPNIKEQSQQCHSSLPILKTLPKSAPNDKRLMRLCGKVWHHLYVLRENGDWTSYKSATQKVSVCFHDNPDVQLILLRCEMLVATFYRNQRDMADEIFQKAMAILPKSSMPDWQLVRFPSAKVQVYTNTKEFDRATCILQEAQQAMSTLAAGSVTGTEKFFEALFMANFLRCTRSGTKSQSIAKMVRNCFQTTVSHYKEDGFFNLQSPASQVNLFIALFELQINFKQIRYTDPQMPRDGDLAFAEQCLNVYESECWSLSTNWSRMLFFIGRAEQHRRRFNTWRCMDYLREAKTCACQGSFEGYVEDIEFNLSLTESKYEEQKQFGVCKPLAAETVFLQTTSDGNSSSENENEKQI